MGLKKGDMIRWVSHHDAFEASPIGVKGISPVHKHGIILEISDKKTTAIVAHCFDCKAYNLVILDAEYDSVQIISRGDDG
tara:strand:+ start:311 stop:550 length:240 start_codon:yes stop_codon:yes gene_type:complete